MLAEGTWRSGVTFGTTATTLCSGGTNLGSDKNVNLVSMPLRFAVRLLGKCMQVSGSVTEFVESAKTISIALFWYFFEIFTK